MTVLDPAVLADALRLIPALDGTGAVTLADALLPNLPSASRIWAVTAVRLHADRQRQVKAGQVNPAEVTDRRPGESMRDHATRAAALAGESLAAAIDAAVDAQTRAAAQADRDSRYSAGMPRQRVTTP
jgi:hypothetical protein